MKLATHPESAIGSARALRILVVDDERDTVTTLSAILADEGHTVVEWVDFPDARYEAVEGDREIVEGVSVLATPGHTPGHQSVTVRAGDGLVLIVGQAAQDARSFATGEADASVRRLRELNADRIHFSHDRAVLRRRK